MDTKLENNKNINVGNHIKDYITINIQSNKWPSGSKIPSERQLAIKFETTSSTVKKVISKFIENGIIESKYRKGYFVCNENILSPGDYLGLIPDPTLKIEFKDLKTETFKPENIEFFEKMLGIEMNNSYKMFKKITSRDDKIIKITYIAINNSKYLSNKEIIKDKKWFKDGFNVKIFNALVGNLIAKKIDIVTSSDSLGETEFDNYACFHSATLNKEGQAIELAVTYVERDEFVFETVKQIN